MACLLFLLFTDRERKTSIEKRKMNIYKWKIYGAKSCKVKQKSI